MFFFIPYAVLLVTSALGLKARVDACELRCLQQNTQITPLAWSQSCLEDRFCYLRTVAGRTAAYFLVESRGSVPGCTVDHHHVTSDISTERNRSRDVLKLPKYTPKDNYLVNDKPV